VCLIFIDIFRTIKYAGEIIGWDDKTKLSESKRNALNRVIWTLQSTETGLYDASSVEGKPSVNLLHVRRIHQLVQPFRVSRLTKTSDGQPVSEGRTTSGGWVYVKYEGADLSTENQG